MINLHFPPESLKISSGEGLFKRNPVKGTVRAEFFAKRNVKIEKALPVVAAGRQFRYQSFFKFQRTGELLPGDFGDDLVNQI
jgi:hypothetical protein